MDDLPSRDALAAVAWLAVNLLLVTAGWRLSRRVFPADPPTARILHTTVFCWATVVMVATLLGLFHALTPAALLAGVAAAALLAHRFGTGKSTGAPGSLTERALLIGWLALMTFGIAYLVEASLLRFPADWDSLMYHIPLIDQWLQSRGLYVPRDANWYNPGNSELMGLWVVAPFSGDFLIGFINIPAAILLSLGAIELARQAGLGCLYASVAGLAALSSYVVVRQLMDAENDVAVAGLFLAGIYYAIRHVRTGGLGDLLLGTASIGLMAGVKYYAIGYGFVAGLILVLAALLARGPRAAVRALAVGLLGALLLGGYWYFRNAWVTGTPFYPKGYNAQTDALAQWRTSIWSSTLLGNGRPEVLPLLIDAVRRKTGLCWLVAFLATPLTLGWLMATGIWRKRHGDANFVRSVRVMLACALAAAGIFWGCIPFAAEMRPLGSLNSLHRGYLPVRFGVSFLCLSVIGLAVVLHDLGVCLVKGAGFIGRLQRKAQGRRIVRAAGMAPLAAFGLATGYQFFTLASDAAVGNVPIEVYLALGVIGLLFVCGNLCWQIWPERRTGMAFCAIVCLFSASSMAARFLAERWHAEFTPFYSRLLKIPDLQQLAARDPVTTNICVLNPYYRNYPFFGSKRQFHVARPVFVSDYAALRQYLMVHDCTVVVTLLYDILPESPYAQAHTWIEERPELFVEIARTERILICEIDKDRLRDAANNLPGLNQ